jgi:hypothetical protein
MVCRRVRVAFATCSALPCGTGDDHEAAKLLGATYRSWDDPAVDWEAYDRVVIRSTWDYTRRIGEFLAWCGRVGSRRLRNQHDLSNQHDLIVFSADKRYLDRFAAAAVPTIYLALGDPTPALEGEVGERLFLEGAEVMEVSTTASCKLRNPSDGTRTRRRHLSPSALGVLLVGAPFGADHHADPPMRTVVCRHPHI